MEGFTFLQSQWLFLLWIPLLLIPFFWIRELHYTKKLGSTFLRDENRIRKRSRERRTALVLWGTGLFSLILGIARPAWGYEESISRKTGRDIVFLIDVSRSMLAEDLYPNRLERAKLAVQDALEVLDGDRVALVAFGGSAVTKCPLTLDYSFFLTALRDLSPASVSRGGSLIGDALRKTMEEVLKGDGGYQDIVLITDGEDQESFPLKAAEELTERGIRLIAIGLGDEETGKRIPITDASGNRSFLQYDGREVWSKLDGDTLREMARLTPGGRYLNVATGSFEFDSIYRTLIKNQEERVIDESRKSRLTERYQLFFLIGIACILIAEAIKRKGQR